MTTTLDEQIKQLKLAIAEMEAQRPVLGNAAVDASLVPFREKLAELEMLAESPKEAISEIPQRKRQLVTLLYMDVVGSTAMTQDLDPEDTMEILEKAILRLSALIKAHGGHVTRYTGDGFKAIFGDPIAREDDPEQAIRAGLKILDVSNAVAEEIEKEWGIGNFQVRIGIDTGLAALGGQTEAEDTVKGRVVNLAVRIESAAPPGGLLISHNTYRHVRGVFNVEPQEPIIAKGFPEPVPVYLVKEIKPRAFRVQTRGVEGVETRMVGRHDELRFFQDALMTAFEEGEGHVVTVSGEAGVGKSRLLYEYQNWLELLPDTQGFRFFQGRGRHEAQGSPYSLLRDVFAFRFQILDDDRGDQARQKIETGFCEVLGEDEKGVMRSHILGQLFGFDFSASPHLKGVLKDPEQLRNRGVMYLIQYFKIWSQEKPIVIFLEDIHWADDSSLDVVSRIGEFTPQYPILIICAARPQLFERRPYWGEGQQYHTCLELRPLSKRESRQLVGEILKLADEIPTELRELVVRGAEGNPFYTEELIKMLIEEGVIVPDEEIWQIDLTRLEEVDVPSTLSGVLQARLDSLPPHERTVLQQASVVGRLFWDRIVTYIQDEKGNGDDPQQIPQVLTSLRYRELVYRHEESAFVDSVEYIFKHDVLREVTYESVLKRLRKTYHGLVADWLIDNSGDRIGEYSGLIAEHLLVARKEEQACQYFYMAGESALASFANSEAQHYLYLALELSPPENLHAKILSGLGEALRLQGKNEDAEPIFRQAIQIYLQLRNFDCVGDIYALLSKSLWRIDYLRAWRICQEGLRVLEGKTDSLGYARLLSEAGRTALFSNVTNQVNPLCYRSMEIAQIVGDLEVQADTTITLALAKEDYLEAIDLLEEMVRLTEENNLLRVASRAHANLAYFLSEFMVNQESALQHELRAVEIAIQRGDIEGLMFCLGELYGFYLGLGKLKTVVDEMNKFFQEASVPASRREKFLDDNLPDLLLAKGEWMTALDAIRKQLEELHQGRSNQIIEGANNLLISAIMELNRFRNFVDLSEIESALKENEELGTESYLIDYGFGIVNARQKHIKEAHDYIFQAENEIRDKSDSPLFELLRNVAEFELSFAEESWENAVDACKKSIELEKSGGYRWDCARRLIDLGDALLGRNDPGDLERARETYQQSLGMFTEMGAPGYIKVLEERLREL